MTISMTHSSKFTLFAIIFASPINSRTPVYAVGRTTDAGKAVSVLWTFCNKVNTKVLGKCSIKKRFLQENQKCRKQNDIDKQLDDIDVN